MNKQNVKKHGFFIHGEKNNKTKSVSSNIAWSCVCVCVTAGVDNVDDGESHYSSTVTQEGHIAYYCCIAKKADLQAQNTLTHFELVDQLFLLFLNVNAENEMK